MGDGCCHGDGHEHKKEGCCKEEGNENGGCCGSESNYDEMTGMMMALSDHAWNELMVEKMKAAWEDARGASMTKMAAVSVEHSMTAWKKKMESKDMDFEPSKEDIEAFKKKLNEAMK